MAVTSTDGGERPSEKKKKLKELDAMLDSLESHGMKVTAEARGRCRMTAVSSSANGNGTRKDGTVRTQPGKGNNGKGRYKLPDACRLQGLPEDFLDDAPFTAEWKLKAVANGVPIPMGRAIAKAVREATEPTQPPTERT